jgi:hypothetical protein
MKRDERRLTQLVTHGCFTTAELRWLLKQPISDDLKKLVEWKLAQDK